MKGTASIKKERDGQMEGNQRKGRDGPNQTQGALKLGATSQCREQTAPQDVMAVNRAVCQSGLHVQDS